MKANIFNDHFVEQCSLINNESTLHDFVFGCNSSLSDVKIIGEKVLFIIRSLDPKKAHDCDDISISMIKICDIEIVKHLYLIYMKCLETGGFPSSCKKANVVSIHKKRKQAAKEKLLTYFTAGKYLKN